MADELRVAVVGLGKIGLPLATQYARKGASVIGCDVDAKVVEAVNAGASTIVGEPGLIEALTEVHRSERLSATTNTSAAVGQSDVVVLIVPVGIDAEHRVDFSHLDAASEAVGRGLRPGTLVILETSVPVGVTRGRLQQHLVAASGLAESEFLLAYSPERVSSGTMFRDLALYPKVVGGRDAASAEAAAAFYTQVLDALVLTVADCETAEFAKLAESVYRDVNIALANELARAADSFGIDYAEVATASNSQPYSHLHAPGVGVGGHCIPVYPYFLLDAVDQPIVALSRQTNDAMASYGVERLETALREETGAGLEGRTVLILGLAYRGGVKEATLSSTLLLATALTDRGARVLVHDPLYTPEEMRAYGLEASSLPPPEPVDAVVLQAAHAEYATFDLTRLTGARVFLDGRRAFDRARVEAAGLRYVAIGLGR